MADINNCGLYVNIKNVAQLKRTFSIIKELKKQNIMLRFETIEVPTDYGMERRNFLKISEKGCEGHITFIIQHELYNDADKFKCVPTTDIGNNFSEVIVKLDVLEETFKKLNDDSQVLFYMFLNDNTKLNINIQDGQIYKEIVINTLEDDEIQIIDFHLEQFNYVCCAKILTKIFNQELKQITKNTQEIQLTCTSSSLRFSTPRDSQVQMNTTITIGDNLAIIMTNNNNDDLTEEERKDAAEQMLIVSTYYSECFRLLSRIDEKFCESVYLYFIPLNENNLYSLVLSYSYNTNESMKIILIPKNIRQQTNINNDQIDYEE